MDIRYMCVLWAQMRAIRILIQQSREKESFPEFLKYHPTSAISLIACMLAMLVPCWITTFGLMGTTLLYNYVLAPYEVDNGATWEWMASAFMFMAPLVSALSGGTLNDGLMESLVFIKVQ